MTVPIHIIDTFRGQIVINESVPPTTLPVSSRHRHG